MEGREREEVGWGGGREVEEGEKGREGRDQRTDQLKLNGLRG